MLRKYEGYAQWPHRIKRLYKLHHDVGNRYHSRKDPIRFIDILHKLVKYFLIYLLLLHLI